MVWVEVLNLVGLFGVFSDNFFFFLFQESSLKLSGKIEPSCVTKHDYLHLSTRILFC